MPDVPKAMMELPLPLVLPPHLDGRSGCNRAHQGAPKSIQADDDVAAIRLWLAEYAASPHTLRNYIKEATRLLLWATEERGKPVSGLLREDFLAYEQFLLNPPLHWSSADQPRRGSRRALLTGPLSSSSVRHSMGIVSGLLSYLVAAGYLAASPLALRRTRQRRDRVRPHIERYLNAHQWAQVLDAIEALPRTTARECQVYERGRWVMRCLYHTALRVSEAAAARTQDLHQRRGRWWLIVTGKGGATGEVPIGETLIADFTRYRRFYGLPEIPTTLDRSPLILSIAGDPEHVLTPTAVYLIVKEQFRAAADALDSDDPASAAILRRASTHWLRHTAATHQADAGNDLRHIQKNLRHASIETTAIYLHAGDEERHRQTTELLP